MTQVTRAIVCAVGCVLCALVPPAAARAAAPACDAAAWRSRADLESLELAAIVDRVGDAAVVACLAESAPVSARLAAVRAAAYLRAPEAALPALVELAAARDPELAPLAARRTFVIAQRLVQEVGAQRDFSPSELSPVRAALQRSVAERRPRADLRLWLEQALQLLSALGVP
jgi:hypothetical protein